jgi:tetratricopeptide (TPR) repeat protein
MSWEELIGEAQSLFVQEKYAEAVSKFTEALAAGADAYLVHLSRGAGYFKLNHLDKAVADFDATIAVRPESLRAHYYRGLAHMAGEDHERALTDLNRVLAIDPDYGPGHFARGTLYGLLGEDEKSAMDMKTAIIKSEAQFQGFADSFGILRTQFTKAMAHLSGDRGHYPTLSLAPEEIKQLKSWLDEESV